MNASSSNPKAVIIVVIIVIVILLSFLALLYVKRKEVSLGNHGHSFWPSLTSLANLTNLTNSDHLIQLLQLDHLDPPAHCLPPDIHVQIYMYSSKVISQVTDYLAERRKRKEELEFSDFRGGMVTKHFLQMFNWSLKIICTTIWKGWHGDQTFLTSVQLVPKTSHI